MNDQVEPDVARLPEPAPPAGLPENVMARVYRLADEGARTRGPAPASPEAALDAHRSGWREAPAFLVALAGLALVCAAWIDGGFEAGWWCKLISSQVWATNVVSPPLDALALFGLAVGLLIFAAGLFAPLRQEP